MKTYHECDSHCKTIADLHLIRDAANFYATKYRFDPLIGKLHRQYLDAINAVIEADKTLGGANV